MSATEKDIVAELVKAANDVHDAAKVRPASAVGHAELMSLIPFQGMKNSKNISRKISKISLEIATSFNNTATITRLQVEKTEPTIPVAAALGAAKEYVLTSSARVFD